MKWIEQNLQAGVVIAIVTLIIMASCGKLKADEIQMANGIWIKNVQITNCQSDYLVIKKGKESYSIRYSTIAADHAAKYHAIWNNNAYAFEKSWAERSGRDYQGKFKLVEVPLTNQESDARRKDEAEKLAGLNREKAKAAEEAAERKAALKDCGTPPEFEIAADDSKRLPKNIDKAFKETLKDPDSFQLRKTVSIEKAIVKGRGCYVMLFTFGAKNGFGGYTLGEGVVAVRNGQVLDVVSRELD